MSNVKPRGTVTTYTATTLSQSYDKSITRERIAADMAAFDEAGGQVEKLGVTPLRRKEAKPEPTVKPSKKSGG